MPSPITAEYIYEVPTVSQPCLSEDGAAVAFVKTTIDRSKMERESQIVVSRRPFDELCDLTYGPNDTAPFVDNERVLFLRPDDNDKKQVWSVPMSGGEATRVTDLAGGVEEFALSPYGDTIAVVSTVDPDALDEEEPDMPRVRVVRRIRYRYEGRGFTGDAFRQLFAVDMESGRTRQLTDGEGDNWSPKWSLDGRLLAYISDDIDGRDYSTHTQAKVLTMPVGKPVSWSEDLPFVWAIAWSPDGESLVAAGSHDPELWDPRSAWLYVLNADGDARRITDGRHTPVPECGLSWTGKRDIVFVGAHRGEYFVCSIRPDGSDFKRITNGEESIGCISINGRASKAAMLVESPRSTAELAYVDLDSAVTRKFTSYAGPYLESHPPALMEKFTISRGSFEIESRVLLPPDFSDTKSYPLVVDIHGGPNGRFTDNFDPVHQIVATNGYIVLTVNPRGSSTYSPEFTKAVREDWGGEDYLDILASVEELASRPYVDENRMVLHGSSYGGFMSSWIVGHDHRFKAAIVASMCANLHSMYGTSDLGTVLGDLNWGGVYNAARDKYLELSPITYAPNVQTPVLLIHGEEDLRCQIEQSEQYFVALKRLGKTVEFARFPDSDHTFRRAGHPTLIVEYYRLVFDWLERYIGAGTG